jgi:hypothetical protein
MTYSQGAHQTGRQTAEKQAFWQAFPAPPVGAQKPTARRIGAHNFPLFSPIKANKLSD